MIDKRIQKNSKTIQHPLFGISTKKWIELLENNGGVDNGFFSRGIFITFTSIFTSPARMLFRLRYDSKIKKTEIKHPPVIIVGHWRTGTTYLHELLSCDPQFCYVTLWHTMLPDSFLILDPMKNFLSNFLPKKRQKDEIRVDIIITAHKIGNLSNGLSTGSSRLLNILTTSYESSHHWIHIHHMLLSYFFI